MVEVTQEQLNKNTTAFVKGIAKLKDKWTKVDWEKVDFGLVLFQFGTMEMDYNSNFASIFNKTIDALLDLPTPYAGDACVKLVGGLDNPRIKYEFRIFQNDYTSYKYIGVYLSVAYYFMQDKLDTSIPSNIILGDN